MDTQSEYISCFNNFARLLSQWTPAQSLHNHQAKVVDFFCGCGGTSLGFASVPDFFKILYGIDINTSALKSFETNFRCKTLCKDIRLLDDSDLSDISKTITEAGEGPLIVVGCCPCQGFSAHRKKDGDKPEDKRNSLIGTFSNLALRLNPDYIVMENVQEVLNGKYTSHYEEAKRIFSDAGYFITQKIYNAASFGVPQARIRAIIVASKKPFSLPDEILTSDNFKTVRDAIGNLPKANDPNGKDLYHYSSKHKQSTIDVISKVPKDGGSRPQNVGPKCLDKVKGFYDVYGRLFWDRPSITITKTARNPASGRFSHPEENRGLTLREAARLQSFPDAFRFEGGSSDRYEQVGEAVPPLLSLAISTKIYLEERRKYGL